MCRGGRAVCVHLDDTAIVNGNKDDILDPQCEFFGFGIESCDNGCGVNYNVGDAGEGERRK